MPMANHTRWQRSAAIRCEMHQDAGMLSIGELQFDAAVLA